MPNIQTISNIAGLISIGITILAIIIGGFYVGKSNASKVTSDAQQDAISAMQSEISVLRGRTEDLKQDNIKQQVIIDTICAALKMRGLIITIQGEMINIQDDKGSTTTTRIQGGK